MFLSHEDESLSTTPKA